jgi:hypothetical protein
MHAAVVGTPHSITVCLKNKPQPERLQMNAAKTSLVLTSLALLVACGGGSSDGAVENTALNPLKKYAGTYYVCNENEKRTIQLTPTGVNQLNVTLSSEVFSAFNCSGNVLGTYRLNDPLVLTYSGTAIATLPPYTVLPFAGTVDRVTRNTSSVAATLTGSGVSGSCVNYTYADNGRTTTGQQCYELIVPASLTTGALYINSNQQYMVQFELINGTYESQIVASTNSSFNLNSLVVH